MQSGLTNVVNYHLLKKLCWLHVPFFPVYIYSWHICLQNLEAWILLQSTVYAKVVFNTTFMDWWLWNVAIYIFCMNTHHDKQYIFCEWYFSSSSLSLLSKCYSALQSSSSSPECFHSHLVFSPNSNIYKNHTT